jgi:hypothetical protein
VIHSVASVANLGGMLRHTRVRLKLTMALCALGQLADLMKYKPRSRLVQVMYQLCRLQSCHVQGCHQRALSFQDDSRSP